MSNDLINTSTSATMSSLEIAELTGKQHKNVLADIRRVLEDVDIQPANFLADYKDDKGRTHKCYNLPRMECDLVVSGYSVKYRLAIIKRWHELEAKNSKPLSPMEMVIQSAQAIIKLEAEQAKQADDIAAIKDRQDKLDGDTKYMTAIAYCREKGIPAPLKVANKLGRDCSRYCKQHGIEIGTVPDERWGSVNSYPVIILEGHLAI